MIAIEKVWAEQQLTDRPEDVRTDVIGVSYRITEPLQPEKALRTHSHTDVSVVRTLCANVTELRSFQIKLIVYH